MRGEDENGETGVVSENRLSGGVYGPNVQAGVIHGDVQFNVGNPVGTPVPAQLPSAGFFADREDELAELRQLTESPSDVDAPLIVVISGTGGVGKTTLGLRWLHQIRESYGDGQLFVDLRGFSGQRPMPPAEPLERFLRALGIDATNMPVDADEQAALFRTLTSGRRLIVMLDNAISAAQVRPLLPGPGPALVVVTTRRRLTGLAADGARFLEVGPLNDNGAVELLNRLLGADRIQNEREEAFELVALCGRLPLAVRASGARLAARRRWPIARVVRELADETRRLATLGGEDDEVSVQAVFNASYGAIADERARRLYRLLGLHPGVDFDAAAAAALIESDHDEASRLLDILAGANLLQEDQDDRYRFHDLIRLHARAEAGETETEAEHEAAVRRLTDWYLRAAVAADLAIMPGRWHLGVYYTDDRRRDVDATAAFEDSESALDWLERERSNLMAVIEHAHSHGLDEYAWQLCEAAWPLFLLHKHYQSWTECYEVGLAAARACEDPKAQARMLTALAIAHFNRRDYSAAIGHYEQVLRLDPPGGHRLGEATALENLGVAVLATGQGERATEIFVQAKAVFEAIGVQRGVALMSRRLAEALSATSRHAEAIDHFAEALGFFAERDEHYHHARTLTGLARAYMEIARHDDAGTTFRAALAAAEKASAQQAQADVRVGLADLAERRAEPEDAREHLRAALSIYTELGAPETEEVTRRLAMLSKAPPH